MFEKKIKTLNFFWLGFNSTFQKFGPTTPVRLLCELKNTPVIFKYFFFFEKAQIKKDQGLTDEEKPETTHKKHKSGKRKKRHRKKKQVRVYTDRIM